MNAKQLTASILLSALLLGGFTGCETNKSKDNMVQTKEKVFTKKYTNADFYVDGKFNGEVALKAYLEMFEFYGVPFTDFMKENMWISDFGLGDSNMPVWPAYFGLTTRLTAISDTKYICYPDK